MMLFFSQSSLQAHTSKNDSLNFNNFEISRPEFCLSSNCTDLTQPYLIQYTKNDFKQLKLLLQRGEIVLPTIERVLRENNVPDEFKYLAYIESNFNNHITSPSGAKGLWQFIKGTAVQNGLKVNNKTDERTNTEKSTLAAATYFKRLDYNYGDWELLLEVGGTLILGDDHFTPGTPASLSALKLCSCCGMLVGVKVFL